MRGNLRHLLLVFISALLTLSVSAQEGDCVEFSSGVPGISVSLVWDIHTSGSSFPKFFASRPGDLDGAIYFAASEPEHGAELWVLEGDSARLKADIYPGASSSSIQGFASASSTLYFLANNGAGGSKLYWLHDVFLGTDNPRPGVVHTFGGAVPATKWFSFSDHFYFSFVAPSFPVPSATLYYHDSEGHAGCRPGLCSILHPTASFEVFDSVLHRHRRRADGKFGARRFKRGRPFYL